MSCKEKLCMYHSEKHLNNCKHQFGEHDRGIDCRNFDYNCDDCKEMGFKHYRCPDCDLTEDEYYGEE